MPAVIAPAHQKGDFLVDYEEKVFEDVKSAPGEKALITFHTVAFEGSIVVLRAIWRDAGRSEPLVPCRTRRRWGGAC